MLCFIDSANLDAIRECVEYYPVDGVTTNPTIISREKTAFTPLLRSIREIIGNGTIGSGFFLGGEELVKQLTISLPFISEHPMMIVALAPGGFFVYACIIAFVNWLINRKGGTPRDFSCQGCALASMCNQEKCVAELGEITINKKGAEA